MNERNEITLDRNTEAKHFQAVKGSLGPFVHRHLVGFGNLTSVERIGHSSQRNKSHIIRCYSHCLMQLWQVLGATSHTFSIKIHAV